MTAPDLAPEAKLWLAAVRQAFTDLRLGHDSLAVDAIEFLDSTGAWLLLKFKGIPEYATRLKVGELIKERDRKRGYTLKVTR